MAESDPLSSVTVYPNKQVMQHCIAFYYNLYEHVRQHQQLVKSNTGTKTVYFETPLAYNYNRKINWYYLVKFINRSSLFSSSNPKNKVKPIVNILGFMSEIGNSNFICNLGLFFNDTQEIRCTGFT